MDKPFNISLIHNKPGQGYFPGQEHILSKYMTCAMRSHRGFHNDLHQAIDQNILCSIECPTLLLHSEYDNAVDASHPINANAKIKNSTIVFFKNHWGHMLWVGIDYKPILDELKKHIEY